MSDGTGLGFGKVRACAYVSNWGTATSEVRWEAVRGAAERRESAVAVIFAVSCKRPTPRQFREKNPLLAFYLTLQSKAGLVVCA